MLLQKSRKWAGDWCFLIWIFICNEWEKNVLIKSCIPRESCVLFFGVIYIMSSSLSHLPFELSIKLNIIIINVSEIVFNHRLLFPNCFLTSHLIWKSWMKKTRKTYSLPQSINNELPNAFRWLHTLRLITSELSLIFFNPKYKEEQIQSGFRRFRMKSHRILIAIQSCNDFTFHRANNKQHLI